MAHQLPQCPGNWPYDTNSTNQCNLTSASARTSGFSARRRGWRLLLLPPRGHNDGISSTTLYNERRRGPLLCKNTVNTHPPHRAWGLCRAAAWCPWRRLHSGLITRQQLYLCVYLRGGIKKSNQIGGLLLASGTRTYKISNALFSLLKASQCLFSGLCRTITKMAFVLNYLKEQVIHINHSHTYNNDVK